MTPQAILNKPCSDDQRSPILRESRRAVLLSGLFLVSIVLLSVMLYVPYLGFYSDDWHFLSLLKNSPDQSFGGLFHSLMSDHNIRVRPVQTAALVGLYQLFGLLPLGYHICNALLLVAMALVLFLLLLELKQPLLLAASLPAVYILLPHYSTDRFWIAAIQANISMVFYFASFYFALRSVRSGWPWLLLSVFSTMVSVLSYEVAVPLFAFNVVAILWTEQFRVRARWAAALTSIALVGCFVFKMAINQRPVMRPGTFWSHAVWLVHQALFINFFQLGIAYPRVVFKTVRYHFDLPALAAAAAIALLVFFCLRWIIRRQPESLYKIAWTRVIATGFVIFGLGYAIFLTTDQVAFHKTGVANRTSIAAALGVALCFLGITGYISTKLTPKFRRLCFPLLVSLICASGSLIDTSLAQYWIRGYDEERQILQNIAAHHLSPPPGSAFLVDGVCPYVGPAPLLESWWEVSGVAQLIFRQPDLAGDAISPRIRLHPDSLSTWIYGDEKIYPYGDRLILYNVALDRVFLVHSAAEMNSYLKDYGKFSTVNMKCPATPEKASPCSSRPLVYTASPRL